jgi:hypothetical protein
MLIGIRHMNKRRPAGSVSGHLLHDVRRGSFTQSWLFANKAEDGQQDTTSPGCAATFGKIPGLLGLQSPTGFRILKAATWPLLVHKVRQFLLRGESPEVIVFPYAGENGAIAVSVETCVRERLCYRQWASRVPRASRSGNQGASDRRSWGRWKLSNLR